MEQLLGQLGSFLGPDATANDSPQLEHRAPPEISRGRTVGGSYGQHLGAPQAVAPPPTSFGGSIDISGVRLSEEDMALLDEPDYDYDHRQYPASAPAWQTSFNFGPSGPHPPFQSRSNALHYTAAPLSPHYPAPQYTSASLAPPLAYSHADFDAPLSAPLRPRSTPILEQQATFAAPPPVSGSGVRRRRSSVDDVASYAHASPISAINSSYTYDQQPNPSQSYPYARPAPTQRHTYSTSPSASSMSSASSPVAVHRLPGQAATPRTSPTKIASPRKTRTSPTKKKGAGGLPMFVNFGASDSKKLLSGVAPSGSSKRRREEQEAAAAAAAASSSS
ncbi:hypothetical protein BCR35DRAFT_158736 [Leucosporidium creatinivorum]|uniref:Developmental regulatory protein wetA n=1 Tax=Leucosporidium creatinivorum TaxID=106004 RepID=A0A1Y2G2E3_9BASI|nr:hypothetical protein BCR35DRAFT_158736 [Leucosporidium creatinivorum]